MVKVKDMISPALESADSSGTKHAPVNSVVTKQKPVLGISAGGLYCKELFSWVLEKNKGTKEEQK